MSFKEVIGNLFTQDNPNPKDSIRINNFEKEDFKPEDELTDVRSKASTEVIMQNTPNKAIVEPFVLLDEDHPDHNPRANITSASLAMVLDGNYDQAADDHLADSLFGIDWKNKFGSHYGSALVSDFTLNTKNIIVESICNAIFEMSTLNLYSCYDISDFGFSEIGGFFDIKRRFFDKMQGAINYQKGSGFIRNMIHTYITQICELHDKNALVPPNFDEMLKGNRVSPTAAAVIDVTSIQLSQFIGNQICMAIHEGLSTVLCDVIGLPNREMIFDVLANNSNYLRLNRNSRAFGEVATIYIEEYYYSKVYSIVLNVINPNLRNLLTDSIISFPFLYKDLYELKKDTKKVIEYEDTKK